VEYIPQYKWQNWNENLECSADLYRPNNLAQLSEAIRRAAPNGRIRPVGNSCAWSPLIPTSGSLLGLEKLKRVTEVNRSGPLPTIRVETGASMRELVKFTRQNGLTLISPTIFQGISIGGAIAVAAHGTGLATSTMSDEVVGLTLVDARGDVHELTAADGELFDAARCSLGALGVVYDVTLRCWPEFHLHVEDRLIDRDTVLSGIDDILNTYEFVELYWFPFNDTMWCKMMSRTSEPDDPITFQQRLKFAFDYVSTYVSCNVILPLVSRAAPELTPAFMKLAPSFAVTPGITVEPASREFHYQKAYPKCWDMSYGVPLADSAEAWRRTMTLIENLGREDKYPVNMVVHSRFIGPSAALLAPAYGRAICDIEVVTDNDTPNIEPFYSEWAREMLAIPGARPHWGKYLLHARECYARYPKMDSFLAHRRALDPNGVFLNDWLEDPVFQLAP
jgi:L-gulono-1,4-lactone dehydrogenase